MFFKRSIRAGWRDAWSPASRPATKLSNSPLSVSMCFSHLLLFHLFSLYIYIYVCVCVCVISLIFLGLLFYYYLFYPPSHTLYLYISIEGRRNGHYSA